MWRRPINTTRAEDLDFSGGASGDSFGPPGSKLGAPSRLAPPPPKGADKGPSGGGILGSSRAEPPSPNPLQEELSDDSDEEEEKPASGVSDYFILPNPDGSSPLPATTSDAPYDGDVQKWLPLYDMIIARLNSMERKWVMPYTLTLHMDHAEFIYNGLNDLDAAYKKLETVLVNYAVNRSGVPNFMQKAVIRYMQRKLIEWGKKKGKLVLSDYAAGALRDRLIHACISGKPPGAEPSGELRELEAWTPGPKKGKIFDFVDVFVAGDQDSWNFRQSDYLPLFFKLRFASLFAQDSQYVKAVDIISEAMEKSSRAVEADPTADKKNFDLVMGMCQARKKEWQEKKGSTSLPTPSSPVPTSQPSSPPSSPVPSTDSLVAPTSLES